MLRRLVMCICLLGALVAVGACQSAEPREQALTGEPQHERHATGIESQAGDQ